MKKIYAYFCFVIMTLACGVVYAQQSDCRDIVLPKLKYDVQRLDRMPAEKVEWYCAFSRNSFFETDTIPQDAVVYDISVLKFKKDGSNVGSDFVVNLNTLSFYAYDFDLYRHKHFHSTVYFHTPSSAHAYLAVRSYIETMRLTNAKPQKTK